MGSNARGSALEIPHLSREPANAEASDAKAHSPTKRNASAATLPPRHGSLALSSEFAFAVRALPCFGFIGMLSRIEAPGGGDEFVAATGLHGCSQNFLGFMAIKYTLI